MNPNKNNRLKIVRIIVPLLFSSLIFLLIYPVAKDLPVLGDGAHHAWIMEEIADKQSLNIETKVYYPMFYHLFGAIVYSFFGITGVKLISPLMFTLSSLFVYLIAKELTKSDLVALPSILLLALSPKIIWYGSQILMEPFVVFFIVAAIYFLIFFYKRQNYKNLILVAFFVGIALSTKQSALFVLVAAPIFLFVNKINYKNIMAFMALIVLVAILPYGFMYFTTHALVGPPPDPILLHFEDSDNPYWLYLLHKRIGGWSKIPKWSRELAEEIDGVHLYKVGTQPHEARRKTIMDMLDRNDLVYLNSLYPYTWYGYSSPVDKVNFDLLQILFLSGFVMVWIYSIKNPIWRVIPIFLLAAWSFMFIPNDPKRYFLYLPVMLSFIYLLPINYLAKVTRYRTAFSKITLLILVFVVVVGLIPYTTGILALNTAQRLSKLQCYSPSKGGIASIQEVGLWIQENSNESDKIFGTSAYEWKYYTGRDILTDYRIYFLSEERINYWLNYLGVKYVIVRQNQVLPDDKWNHLEFYPESFVKKIEEMYPLVYRSSFGDIIVYKVRDGQNDK